MPGDGDYTDMTNERTTDVFESIHEVVFQTIYWFVKYIPAPIGCFLRFAVLKIFMKEIHSWKILEGAAFYFPRHITIGRHCFIHDFVTMGGRGELVIGDYVSLAHGAAVYSEDHSFRRGKYWHLQKMIQYTTVIEDDVALGAGSKVIPGIRVGRGALVGPNSVVTADVPPNGGVVGIPARLVAQRGDGPRIEWIKPGNPGSEKKEGGKGESQTP